MLQPTLLFVHLLDLFTSSFVVAGVRSLFVFQTNHGGKATALPSGGGHYGTKSKKNQNGGCMMNIFVTCCFHCSFLFEVFLWSVSA